MDADRFDRLARLFAKPADRRRAVGVVVGAVTAMVRRPAAAGKTCCGSTWDCGDCACMCMPDGSFQGCCCGTDCPAGPGNSGSCCQQNAPTCCNGVCCPVSQVCSGPGVCTDSCPNDTNRCGTHCCATDKVCVNDGVCVDTCPPGKTQCGHHCCDACDADGNGCGLPPPPPCTGTMCNGQCCAAGVGCDLSGLACAVPCDGGLLPCHGFCILPCAPNLVLNADTCACECPGTTAPCGDKCANLKTDKRHCGRCGKHCRPGQRCRGGKCR